MKTLIILLYTQLFAAMVQKKDHHQIYIFYCISKLASENEEGNQIAVNPDTPKMTIISV